MCVWLTYKWDVMDILGASSIFHLVAWIGTGLAVIFLILMFVGLDDALDGWFVQRVAVAFACGFGWTGVILLGEGKSLSTALGLSILVGSVIAGGLVGVILLLKRFSESPSEGLSELVGKTAEVYASTEGEDELKIKILFQGRLQEMMATKKTPRALPMGTAVKVTEVLSTGKLVVCPLD